MVVLDSFTVSILEISSVAKKRELRTFQVKIIETIVETRIYDVTASGELSAAKGAAHRWIGDGEESDQTSQGVTDRTYEVLEKSKANEPGIEATAFDADEVE